MPDPRAELSPTRQYAQREHDANSAAKAHAERSTDRLVILRDEFKGYFHEVNWYAVPGSILLLAAMAGWVVGRWWCRPHHG